MPVALQWFAMVSYLEGAQKGAQLLTISNSLLLIVLGALIAHLWNRYRTRLIPLRWSVDYHKVAVAAEDVHFGKVEVLYDGKPVTNLHTAFLTIQNDSNRDLENLALNIACLDNSTIARSSGFVQGSFQEIPWTNKYTEDLTTAKDQELGDLLKRRDYQISVLNRNAKAYFHLLLSKDDAAQPNVGVACDYKGVQVRHQPPSVMWWGVPDAQARLVGLVISFAIAACLVWLVSTKWVVALGTWLAAVAVILLGVMFVKLWRWFGRILS